jgi:hypothetical protein
MHFRGGRFIDRDLDEAVRLALRGLIHESAAWRFPLPLVRLVSLIAPS